MRVGRHRRYSTEFKLQLVEAYLAGDGSAKGLADEHGICHSLILIWAEKYRKGELTLDVQREEEMRTAPGHHGEAGEVSSNGRVDVFEGVRGSARIEPASVRQRRSAASLEQETAVHRRVGLA